MADYVRVSIQGSMPGSEKWSINPVYSLPGGAGGITQTELNTLLEAINDLVVPTNIRVAMNANTAVTGARLEVRNTSGALLMVAEGLRDATQSGTGSLAHPYQTSIVCSLRTNTPGGRGRGRLYWPATGQAISGTTLRIADTNQATLLDGFTSYLAAINAEVQAFDAESWLSVYSPTNNALSQVLRLQVGDVVDTQRRRRDALPESYVTGNYAPLP